MERKQETGAGQSAPFDRASLWDRVDNDMDLLRDLVQIFGQEYPAMLQKLDEALAAGNCTEIGKLGHKIRGAALQFSAPRVALTAARLEAAGASGSLEGVPEACAQLKVEIAELLEGLWQMTNSNG